MSPDDKGAESHGPLESSSPRRPALAMSAGSCNLSLGTASWSFPHICLIKEQACFAPVAEAGTTGC